ncbi:AraC family transcriptional regulator [Neisseriaceae bacterium TC5R-5]|nr:AraC family transcriptional regulator [Neisseriaceae bacterium TC5R-5]
MQNITLATPVASAGSPVRFWRDPDLPFIEARAVADGRQVCYARHAHACFSIGAITAGQSTYWHGDTQQQVAAGAVVLMNPQQVHACNPIANQPWSYLMCYIDIDWLSQLQHELGIGNGTGFVPFAAHLSIDPALYRAIKRLYWQLVDVEAEAIHKQEQAIGFFGELHQRLQVSTRPLPLVKTQLKRAAEFIQTHYTENLTLEQIAQQAGLSVSRLVRAFSQQYGMTPHAYLLNQRIQYSQRQLRCGYSIAEVAAAAGFADQAHFQRTFKRLLAVTPGQYQRA